MRPADPVRGGGLNFLEVRSDVFQLMGVAHSSLPPSAGCLHTLHVGCFAAHFSNQERLGAVTAYMRHSLTVRAVGITSQQDRAGR